MPLYGLGLDAMYLIVSLEKYSAFESVFATRAALFLTGAAAMTAIEYIAGMLSLKLLHVRLWDYSGQWGNVQGIICPKFSAAWAALVAVYYFLIHPYILDALAWLSRNLAFSFFIGLFFGVFIIDAVNSAGLIVKLRRYAAEHEAELRWSRLKPGCAPGRTQNTSARTSSAPSAPPAPSATTWPISSPTRRVAADNASLRVGRAVPADNARLRVGN